MTNRPTNKVCVAVAVAAVSIAACTQDSPSKSGGEAKSDVVSDASVETALRTPIEAPVDVRYRLLGVPQVGQPVNIEISLLPLVDAASLGFNLRTDDALNIEAASRNFTTESVSAREVRSRAVSITPQREGRFYINVNAMVKVNDTVHSRFVTIPIQVGTGGPELEQMGEVIEDEDGNKIISLPAN